MVGGKSVGRWNWWKKKEYSKRLKSTNDVCSCTAVLYEWCFQKAQKDQGLPKIQKCRVHALHSCFHDRMHLEGALADPRGMDTSIECLRWLWRICSECVASKQKLDNRKGSGFQVMSLVNLINLDQATEWLIIHDNSGWGDYQDQDMLCSFSICVSQRLFGQSLLVGWHFEIEFHCHS